MPVIPELREMFDPPDEIIQAGLNGDLVLFIGAGASIQIGLPSWSQLAKNVLYQLRENDLLNYSEIDQLLKLDPRKQLSIAQFISEDNGFSLNLSEFLITEEKSDLIYKSLNDIGCPCVTTNYDEYLKPVYIEKDDGSTTPGRVRRVSKRDDLYENLLNEPGTVIHLHGSVSEPDTMVISTKDYLQLYDHENVKVFLSELFKKKTVLFIGYRLEETEILEHILRRGSVGSTMERRRFSLQGFFRSHQPLYEKLYNYYEKSFGVHLLGFVLDHENYDCLRRIIELWVNQIKIRRPPLLIDVEAIDEVLGSE